METISKLVQVRNEELGDPKGMEDMRVNFISSTGKFKFSRIFNYIYNTPTFNSNDPQNNQKHTCSKLRPHYTRYLY